MAEVLGFSVVPYGSPLVGTFIVPGSSLKASVRKEVAPLMLGLAADFHKFVEPLDPKTSGCHNPRKIASTDTWSKHAPGIAWDFNWNKHPMGSVDTFTPAQEVEIRKLLKKWSFNGVQLFRWGGDFRSRKDEMHFELNVARTYALAAVKALQTPVVPPKRHITWYKGDEGTRTLRLGDRGEDVEYVQRYIGPLHCGKADGILGPRTVSGIKWYQKLHDNAPTGVVDRPTWRTLEVRVKY